MTTLHDLTTAMHQMVTALGRYHEGTSQPQTPRNIAVSLALEAAEVLEHYQWREQADPAALTEELADVALYLLQLAQINGIDLEQAILEKIRYNYTRFGLSPESDPCKF